MITEQVERLIPLDAIGDIYSELECRLIVNTFCTAYDLAKALGGFNVDATLSASSKEFFGRIAVSYLFFRLLALLSPERLCHCARSR